MHAKAQADYRYDGEATLHFVVEGYLIVTAVTYKPKKVKKTIYLLSKEQSVIGERSLFSVVTSFDFPL